MLVATEPGVHEASRDGELVALDEDGKPDFPLICECVLQRQAHVPLTYVLFDVHGKDMTLQLEGRLRAQNGYLIFDPVSGQIGSLPIPQSALESAVRRLMESPENREKLRLLPQIADLRIENGEVVASYR